MAEGHGLLVEFPDASRPFALGFEAGKLWEALQWAVSHGEEFEQTFHAENAEVVIRMCERLEVTHRAEIVDDNWMHGYFDASPMENDDE
jgi:thiamine monophosphate kinase